MGFIETLFFIFGNYSPLISFFGAFFLSLETIFTLSVLSVQGIIPLWVIFIFCSLGMLSSDLLWFSVGKIKHLSYLKKNKYIYAGYKKAGKILDKKKNYFILFSLNKIVYGMGIPALMYLGRKKRLSYKEFFKYDIAIILFWITIMITLGWLTGKGIILFYTAFKSIQLAILILLIIIIIIYLIKILIRRILIKNNIK